MTSNHRRFSLSTILSLAASFLIGTVASGAVIQWGAPQTIGGDSDAITTGSLEFAYNLGGTGTAATTVNGVPFTPFVVTGFNSSATFGRLSFSTFHTFSQQSQSPLPLVGGTAAGSSNAPYSLLSNAYKALLSTSVSAGSGINETLSLNGTILGLTIGSSYSIELWSNNSSVNTGLISLDSPAVVLDPNSTNASGGVGQFVTGTFVANAATQSFFFSTGLSSAPIYFNAIELRSAAVPEASSFSLMAACALPFAVMRYRLVPKVLDASH